MQIRSWGRRDQFDITTEYPTSVEIVGKPRGDWALLQLAHAFEQATGHGKRRPMF